MFMNKIMLCTRVSVPIVFIFLPKRELESFIFFGNIRMVIQIIPEVQLIMVAFLTNMQMIDFIRKALGCISPVQ